MLIQELLTGGVSMANLFVSMLGAIVVVIAFYEIFGSVKSYFSKATDQKNAEESTARQMQAVSVFGIGLAMLIFGILSPIGLIAWKVYTKISR